MERLILIMQIRKILLIPLLFLFLAFPARADVYYIYNCGATFVSGTPDNPNIYILQNDVTWNQYSCFVVRSNVILDLNGHRLVANVTGGVNAPVYGVTFDGVENSSVRNGTIEIYTNNTPYAPQARAGIFIRPTSKYLNITDINVYIEGWDTNSQLMGIQASGYTGQYTGTNFTVYNSFFNLVGHVPNMDIRGIYFTYVRNSSITYSKIKTEPVDGKAYDLYFDSYTAYNYVCAEFNSSKVVDYGTGNSINVCLYTPPTACNCTDWIAAECVSSTQRKYTRICTPSGCDVEMKYENDPSCAPVAEYPWLGLLNTLLSPFWLIMAMIFGMSATVEKKLQAGGIAFITSLIILLFIFAFFTRSIPLWIPVIFLIIAVGYMIFRGRV
jgi:hypothetical protein